MLDISAWVKECMMHSKRAQPYLVSINNQFLNHEIYKYIESRGNGASLMKIGTKRRRTKVQMELDAQQEESDRQLLEDSQNMKAQMQAMYDQM